MRRGIMARHKSHWNQWKWLPLTSVDSERITALGVSIYKGLCVWVCRKLIWSVCCWNSKSTAGKRLLQSLLLSYSIPLDPGSNSLKLGPRCPSSPTFHLFMTQLLQKAQPVIQGGQHFRNSFPVPAAWCRLSEKGCIASSRDQLASL